MLITAADRSFLDPCWVLATSLQTTSSWYTADWNILKFIIGQKTYGNIKAIFVCCIYFILGYFKQDKSISLKSPPTRCNNLGMLGLIYLKLLTSALFLCWMSGSFRQRCTFKVKSRNYSFAKTSLNLKLSLKFKKS